jgi:hypothetical protein
MIFHSSAASQVSAHMHLTMELQVWCPMYFASVVICDSESVCSGCFGVVPFVMFFCVKDTTIQDSSLWAW